MKQLTTGKKEPLFCQQKTASCRNIFYYVLAQVFLKKLFIAAILLIIAGIYLRDLITSK